jgi:hypothetical protein
MVRRCRSGMRPDQPIPPFDPTPMGMLRDTSRMPVFIVDATISDTGSSVGSTYRTSKYIPE